MERRDARKPLVGGSFSDFNHEEWLAPTLSGFLPKHFGAAQTHQIRNAPAAWLYYHPHVRAKHDGFFYFWGCIKCCQEKRFICDRYLRKPSPEWTSALTIFLVSMGSPLLVRPSHAPQSALGYAIFVKRWRSYACYSRITSDYSIGNPRPIWRTNRLKASFR